MKLWDLVSKGDYKSISLIGMAKNVGKTVTLKYLLNEAYAHQKRVGVTSVGRDGEPEDVLKGNEKPLIWVQEGTLIATATEPLLKAHAKLEIVEDTGLHCALGPIYLAKVLRSGYVELAGAPIEQHLRGVIKLMRTHGAALVLVDGAFDRQGMASPTVTDATILATGMALHSELKTMVNKTVTRVEQLTVPAAEESLQKSVEFLIKNGCVALVSENGDIKVLPVKSALGNELEIIKALHKYPETARLVISGAVVDRTLKMVLENQELFKRITIVIKNGTCLFVAQDTWHRFKHGHGKLVAIEPIKLLAVTVNPTAPSGEFVPPEQLVRHLASLLPDTPVFDLVAQVGSLGCG